MYSYIHPTCSLTLVNKGEDESSQDDVEMTPITRNAAVDDHRVITGAPTSAFQDESE